MSAGRGNLVWGHEQDLMTDVQHLFETARDYAALANRASANHLDLLLAHDESSHSSRSLRRESKKRRRGEFST